MGHSLNVSASEQIIQQYLAALPIPALIRIRDTKPENWVSGTFYKASREGVRRCLLGVAEDWDRTYKPQDRDIVAISCETQHHQVTDAFDILCGAWGTELLTKWLYERVTLLLEAYQVHTT